MEHVGHSLVTGSLLYLSVASTHLWQQLPDHFHCCVVFRFGDVTQDFESHSFRA